MEKMLISGVAKDTDVARISVTGIPLFTLLRGISYLLLLPAFSG